MKHITDWINENKGEIKHYVDGILVSDDEKILILRRANYMKNFGGQWGFVGGSVDKKDKNNKEAIIREIEEETKIKLTFNEQQKMKAIDKQEHENNGSVVSDTEYWLIKLESNPDVKISREHSKYEWIDADTFKNKTFKFMPDVFHYIQKYFNGDL
jgi:8-oxo-dGTP pyrophosphatase MutT (NUDIX family)